MLSLFPKGAFKSKPISYREAALSDFSGGLNVRDKERAMASAYAPVLINLNPYRDRTMGTRWGTCRKATTTGAVTGNIRELIYFEHHVLAVTTTGQIGAYGTYPSAPGYAEVTAIWNSAFAALLPGTPSGWSSSTSIPDSTEFKGSLIIVDNVNKPLLINSDLDVEYLNDPATGSNVNTPIGAFVTTVGNYVVMAGIFGAPDDIYISSAGTSGVWPGDPAPNDSIVMSIGSYVPANSGGITALASFRNYLLVGYEKSIVVVELGIYDGTDHTPKVQEAIIEHGMLNHRSIITTKNDLIMASGLGWHAAKKNTYGLIETQSLSELIDPAWVGEFDALARVVTRDPFALRDPLEGRLMVLAPNTSTSSGFAMLSSDKETIRSPRWSQYEIGKRYSCGCTTDTGRVFVAYQTKIFQLGNDVYRDEEYTSDGAGEWTNVWTASTAYAIGDIVGSNVDYANKGTGYICLVAHTSSSDASDGFADDLDEGYWAINPGSAIEFEWEFPWSPMNTRGRTKNIKEINPETEGAGTFTLSLFADNYYQNPETGALTPQLEMDFVGADGPGYGNGDQTYGGGRRTKDARGWGLPFVFKLMKMRITGETYERLTFTAFNILYRLGSFRR